MRVCSLLDWDETHPFMWGIIFIWKAKKIFKAIWIVVVGLSVTTSSRSNRRRIKAILEIKWKFILRKISCLKHCFAYKNFKRKIKGFYTKLQKTFISYFNSQWRYESLNSKQQEFWCRNLSVIWSTQVSSEIGFVLHFSWW
jgi:hypothetical protein